MSFRAKLSDIPDPPQSGHTGAETFKELTINLEQTFQLIDQILPLDSCLYHQILPLELTNDCLTLGMVNLEDALAIQYVRSVLAALNYNFKPQLIETKTYQSVISAYFYYTRTARKKRQDPLPQQVEPIPSKLPQAQSKGLENPNDRATLIVDVPEEDELVVDKNPSPKMVQPSNGAINQLPLNNQSRATDSIPSLEVQARYLSASTEFLANLNPKQLWQELLARVLTGGIGRIYLERHHDYGRIFWSKNGVWQSSIEKINTSIFQGVIEELKQLASLPSTPIDKPKKFEIERYYRNERILLRLRVGPGKYGEEGTLQILRGKALEFYQQKQMDELGEQALQIAQQLERKMRQVRARGAINPTRPKAISAIGEILTKIEQQLDAIAEK